MTMLRLGAIAIGILVLFAVSPMPAVADFQAGQIAAHNGDHETAMAEWLPLAEEGHAKSQYAVGALFAEGLGTRQSLKKAFRWWEKAAEQGHAGAQYNIAVMYMDGLGVRTNTKMAIEWLNRAAKLGNTDAHVQLSRAYRAGRGVGKDPVLSYMWLEIARLSGRTSVARSLESEGADLSGDQIAGATARAQAWMSANTPRQTP
jgi:TPR repeat protein